MPISLIIFLTIASVLRFSLALLFPLTADESYYWLWAKHLSLSYVDHPPMAAYISYLFTLGRESLPLLRLGCVAVTLLTTLLVYFLAKKVFDEKVAVWSAVLFQVLPHFAAVWLTMYVELPLVLCWTGALLVLTLAIKSKIKDKKSKLWCLLGIIIGLGCLSKYTMFLFWPCLAIFFLIEPGSRFWLKRKEPYLCFLLSAACFLPVLVWNYQHAWASFAFHGAKAAADAWGANFLPFAGDQLVHYTPFLIFALYNVYRWGLKKDAGTRLLFAFSAPVLLLFFLLSFKVKIWAHWTEVGYLGALPLTVGYLIERGKSLKKFITWTALFAGLVLAILLLVSPGVLLHQAEYRQNYGLAAKLPPEYKVFAKTNVSASLLEFYLKRPTYLATGFLMSGRPWGAEQYELWGIPGLKKGETALYYGEDNSFFRARAAKYFTRTTELPDAKLYLVEDYITNNYKMFKLEGFKEERLHP
ncbi:MAG: glycosyltransferase family 39 protein [Candidatus Saganbacteria bacterium]|nr:glycosyltransferase family 39 protein [Candidatus Saganbacteria bacterium]